MTVEVGFRYCWSGGVGSEAPRIPERVSRNLWLLWLLLWMVCQLSGLDTASELWGPPASGSDQRYCCGSH